MEQRYFEKLRELFLEHNNYELSTDDALISSAASTVISKGYVFEITPAEIELDGAKKGKILKQVPKSLKNVYQYFLDENGRVIFMMDMECNPRIINRVICQYTEEYTLIYHYTSGMLNAVQLYSPAENVLFGKGRYGEYKYEYYYEDNRLVKFVRHQAYNTTDIHTNDFLFEYKDDKISQIRRECPNGYKEIIYPIRKSLT